MVVNFLRVARAHPPLPTLQIPAPLVLRPRMTMTKAFSLRRERAPQRDSAAMQNITDIHIHNDKNSAKSYLGRFMILIPNLRLILQSQFAFCNGNLDLV